MRRPASVDAVAEFGRIRLSRSFFMRDFLFSDIAAINGFSNIPDDPDLAVKAGTQLCEQLLEPLQNAFGRVAIRSAYRSSEVNAFGNVHGHNCASNALNAGRHIWDARRTDGGIGATACIIVPSFWDAFQAPGDWQRLAWWIHDHLPYSAISFHPVYWAFNLTWSDVPERTIYSHVEPKGLLTKPGAANSKGSHAAEWRGVIEAIEAQRRRLPQTGTAACPPNFAS